jgi:hypothetical protein
MTTDRFPMSLSPTPSCGCASDLARSPVKRRPFRGVWEHEGEIYRDDLVRVCVDADDRPASREFFVQFKERLKTQFEQLDIWLVTYLVEVL